MSFSWFFIVMIFDLPGGSNIKTEKNQDARRITYQSVNTKVLGGSNIKSVKIMVPVGYLNS